MWHLKLNSYLHNGFIYNVQDMQNNDDNSIDVQEHFFYIYMSKCQATDDTINKYLNLLL